MKAKYVGVCTACGRYHIQRGDEIVRFNRGWAKQECIDRKKQRDKEIGILSNVLIRMRNEHSIVLGYAFVVPEGCTKTCTRREFIRKGRELEAISEEEERVLLHRWQEVLDVDLAN